MRITRIWLAPVLALACGACATAPNPSRLVRDIRSNLALGEDYTQGLCRGVVYESRGFRPNHDDGRTPSERAYITGLQDGARFHDLFIRNDEPHRLALEETLQRYGFQRGSFVGIPDSVYRAAILPLIDQHLARFPLPEAARDNPAKPR